MVGQGAGHLESCVGRSQKGKREDCHTWGERDRRDPDRVSEQGRQNRQDYPECRQKGKASHRRVAQKGLVHQRPITEGNKAAKLKVDLEDV